LRAAQSRHGKPAQADAQKGAAIDTASYQGRRWVTRRNLFIDRLAAIWLIKRFIDAKARFLFVSEGESVEGAVGFDMYDRMRSNDEVIISRPSFRTENVAQKLHLYRRRRTDARGRHRRKYRDFQPGQCSPVATIALPQRRETGLDLGDADRPGQGLLFDSQLH
jgi:hypothetical protein